MSGNSALETGSISLANDWHTGITVQDTEPSIFYRDGSGNIGEVGDLSLLPAVQELTAFSSNSNWPVFLVLIPRRKCLPTSSWSYCPRAGTKFTRKSSSVLILLCHSL